MGNGTNRQSVDYFAGGNGGIDSASKETVEEREIGDTGSGGASEKPAPGSSAGNRAEGASGESGEIHKTVNPADLGDIYQRDENGNIVLKADGTPAKKRGRKKGFSPNQPSAKVPPKGDKTAIAVEMLAAQFKILNTCLAFITRFDDFALDDNEAMAMAVAAANVIEQFDYTPDPKITAIVGLVTTTSMIYGPRIYLYKNHLAKKTKEKRESAPIPEREPGHDMDWMRKGPNQFGQFN